MVKSINFVAMLDVCQGDVLYYCMISKHRQCLGYDVPYVSKTEKVRHRQEITVSVPLCTCLCHRG